MSLGYRAVGWNRSKRIYDGLLLAGVALYLALFVGGGALVDPEATAETLLIRGFGSAAFLLLHVILATGPLARLDPRWLPLLYNRRHMGVTMFGLGLAHGALALLQFHGFGNVNPLVSLLTSNTHYDSLARFPFQPLGFAALGILFVMAATSHDFWLANLSAPVWKRLHMLVYAAYGLLVMHVTLGYLQSERAPLLAGLVGVGLAAIALLHLAADRRGAAADRARASGAEGWVDVCAVDAIPESRAVTLQAAGETIAVFRWERGLSALSGICQHQNGPLGEGRVIDGFVTCPWHGYQYQPDCGASPAPFEERVPTFRLRVRGGRVEVDPRPLPPGTRVEPTPLPEVLS